MEPVHDLYKNSLDNILDSNINDTIASIINTKPCLLRQSTLGTEQVMLLDVFLLLGLFSEVTNDGDKNSSLSIKRSISPTLPPSIMLKKPSNPLFKPSGNYGKLRKRKSRAAFTFWGLRDLGYIIDQSRS